MAQVGVLSTVHLSHASFTDLLKNLVMANGRADHTIPPAIDGFALDVTP